MIVHDCKQGSSEWLHMRLGIPTASQFGRIITAATAKSSTASDKYLAELVAERLLGGSLDPNVTEWMARGSALEEAAVLWYELERDCDTSAVGFLTTDDGRVGCSPDRLCDGGGLEIKCPSPAVHVDYLINGAGNSSYKPQVQGAMWMTGADWWDFVSYHPTIPPVMVRFPRDDKYILRLGDEIEKFLMRLDAALEKTAYLMPRPDPVDYAGPHAIEMPDQEPHPSPF